MSVKCHVDLKAKNWEGGEYYHDSSVDFRNVFVF